MGECGIGCDQPRRADGSWEPEQSRRGDAAGERPVAVVWEDIKGRAVGLERWREGQVQRGQGRPWRALSTWSDFGTLF